MSWNSWNRRLAAFGLALTVTVVGTVWLSLVDICTVGGRWLALGWLAAAAALGFTSIAAGKSASKRLPRGLLYVAGGLAFALLLYGVLVVVLMANFCVDWSDWF